MEEYFRDENIDDLFAFFKENNIRNFWITDQDKSNHRARFVKQKGKFGFILLDDENFFGNQLMGVIDNAALDVLEKLSYYEDIEGLSVDFKSGEIPFGINRLKNLKLLEIRRLSDKPLPLEVCTISNLNKLIIYELNKVPAEIGKLSNLVSLQIDGDFIDLPSEIGSLTKLNSLSIQSSLLVNLPPEIGYLSNLTMLDLYSDKIESLPKQIEQLANLKKLCITYSDRLSEEVKSHRKHIRMPEGIWRLYKLEELNLSGTLLFDLPSEIGQLSNLVTLNLSDTQLTNLPPEIEQLSNLVSLNLSKNQLATLPSQIGKLANLTDINLGANELVDLPIKIWNLINLKTLLLNNNRLINLPPEMGNLVNLTELHLASNEITSLPLEIDNLTHLAILDLNENKLHTLPPCLRNLKELKALGLYGNLLPIPPEILRKDNEAQVILNYLAWVWDGKRQPLAETKMLVVGQGSVGKTSLIWRLTNNMFSPAETKTEGIAINRWQVTNTEIGENQPEVLRVNIWDFGGQEIMHATHQFFLTRRSLYVLVLDSRISQEENRVEYWLKIIQSFGGESPVLLVGNKTDQHPLDIDRTGLQKKYPNIIGILETSAATGAGLEELKSTIAAQVNALPHVRDSIPEAWFNVKAQLEELGHEQNYISQERYEQKCAELEVKDELSQRTLIGFLHDLGIVLHFQDDPRLEALGILNPQWVTNGVYKILNAHALFQNKGVLERSMLADILPEDDYPANKRLFIVDMMRKFELCYDIVPDHTFLVPDLLPKDEQYTGEWDGALAFQYHYNVLPSSIVSRFIVRMNGFIHKTVWRAGVVLQKDGNTALVKADTEDRKIYIWVNGAEHTRRDFLYVIRAEFDAIHKTIIKIEAVQKVPHPDYPDLVLDYEELLKFEQKQIPEFQRSVKDDIITVNVRQLLNGVRVGSESAPVVKNVPPPAVAAVKVETAPVQPAAGKPSLLVRILSAVFVSLPRVIGRFALDIFGRGKDSADSTSVLLGYVLIVLSALVVWGIVDVNSLRDWFAGWWRFFFPVKP